jgi:hypothetical protein
VLSITGENDEHPPTDIQRGQAFMSSVINAVCNGMRWQDSRRAGDLGEVFGLCPVSSTVTGPAEAA